MENLQVNAVIISAILLKQKYIIVIFSFTTIYHLIGSEFYFLVTP